MNNTINRFSGKIYPDKSFSLGIVPRPKKRLEDELYDKDCEHIYDAYQIVKSVRGRKRKITYEFLSSATAPNRLVKGPESSRKPKKYGSNGITTYGKRNIRCIGAILQNRYKKSRLGFGTCTVPQFSHIVLRIIGCEWSEITRRFFQKLRRCCAKKGKEFVYFGCTEIQEKRYKRTGIPVPHLHFGYVSRDSSRGEFYFSPAETRKYWSEAIRESLVRVGVTVEDEKVTWLASIDLQRVKKSISAYMAKYLTKGCATVNEMVENGNTKWLPKQWWFASMQCKKWFKESIIRMPQEMCASFFYDLEEYLHSNQITWCNYIEAEVSKGEFRIMGLVGKLSWDCYGKIKNQYCIT